MTFLNYGVQIKNESAEFGSSIGGEIKSLLGNFKSDINPNIERLQSHIEIYKIVARILETKFLNKTVRSRSQLFLLVTAYLFFKLNAK